MANKVNLRICLAIIVFLLLMTGLTQAATITVGPGASYDFDNIQSGIDAAVDGDTVLVAPAEYVITEPITFRGKTIMLLSEAGSEETTIRMGTPADTNRGSVVVFENNETVDSVLEGFTITGGKGFFLQGVWGGGGILFIASSGTLNNCVIVQNQSRDAGGGVCCAYDSSVTMNNCIIIENSAERGGGGGGVFVYSGSSASLTNCEISGNSAKIESGGGICCAYDSFVTINNCAIIDNSTQIKGGGGVMSYNKSQATLNNCLIARNSTQWGGGVMSERESSSTLTNCIICENSASLEGGGVLCYNKSLTIITNCTIWGNSAAQSGGGVECLDWSSSIVTNSIIWKNSAHKGCELSVQDAASTLTITYSNVADGQTGVRVDGGSTLDWGIGNIDVDPLFANLGYWADVNDPNIIVEPNDPNAIWIDGDYHLKSEAGRWDPLRESWVVDDVTSPCIDAGDPNSPIGDEPEPNGGRINMGAYGGTAEASLSTGTEEIVYVQWLGHSTVKVWTEDCVVYVDPERVPETLHDATLVCVTHTHGDHYSPSDISKVSNTQTQFIAPPDVVQRYGSGQTIAPGQTIEFDFVSIKAVSSYNINKSNHPKSNNWVGYVIELGGKRVYVAGDTDLIEEMKSLGDINVAFLPAGGTYTMNATEAAEATGYIKPDLAIPYHWGQSVGTLGDAQRFVELAQCPAMVLTVNETVSSDNWPEYSPLVAHWPLDEAEGDIAHDIAGGNHGMLSSEPAWQLTGGKIDGAIQFDGIDDYISTDFVLDPANGPFSVFAWIKGGAAGQPVISQADGTGSGEIWLGADPMLGKLLTDLVPPAVGRFVPQPLVSESIVIDGQWHHIGFVWDGSYRSLYVDGTEVARDTTAQNPLKSANGGLYIGAGKTLAAGTFFSSLIDDVRIYDVALNTEQIQELAY